MQINGVDLKKLKLEDLQFLIKKYKIGDYNNPPNDQKEAYKLVKRFTIQKIKQKKINKGLKVRKLSAPIVGRKRDANDPKAPPFRDRRMSAPGTSTEFQHSNEDIQQQKHKVFSNPQVSPGDLLKYGQLGMFPKCERLVAIGDLHGDLQITIAALKLAGVVGQNITPQNALSAKWVGGNTVIVQLGDQMDRARPNDWKNDCIEDYNEVFEDEGSSLIIMRLLESLNQQARQFGGKILGALGNHELMNVDHDFRYVSPKEFLEFVPGQQRNKVKTECDRPWGFFHRKEAFKRGGNIAKTYANSRFGILQVGSWIFVHGGLSPELAEKYTIGELNQVTKQWLLNDKSEYIEKTFDKIFRDDDDLSPYWCRIFSEEDNQGNNTEENFDKMLKLLNEKNKGRLLPMKGLVIAHTPQYMYNRNLNGTYGNRLWRVDVGMSRAFGKHKDEGEDKFRKVQVLVIYNDEECERKCVDFWGRPQTTEARCRITANDLASTSLPF